LDGFPTIIPPIWKRPAGPAANGLMGW
jgi:hypothetical protein